VKRFLVIQTAFIGDVILATSVVEKLKEFYPASKIDFLLRKGNEGLLKDHPKINRVFILNKQKQKYRNVLKIIRLLRKQKYDYVFNLQRFFTTGLITLLIKGKVKAGFRKNPLSVFYNWKFRHEPGNGEHEITRNQQMIFSLTDDGFVRPGLYPSDDDYQKVKGYKREKYVCIAPTSVWYTKQFPSNKWIELINRFSKDVAVILIGGPGDQGACEDILKASDHSEIINLAGHLSFLQTAALMEEALMNYVNDSAPLHIASAMNASVTAVFCSTIPEFGFYPVSDESYVVQTETKLYCRPCGLHGYKSCPEGHFLCAKSISTDKFKIY